MCRRSDARKFDVTCPISRFYGQVDWISKRWATILPEPRRDFVGLFAVASVRRSQFPASTFRLAFTSDGVTKENVSLSSIIRAAYGMFNTLDDKFIGISGWVNNEDFDIEAKVDNADVAAFQKLNFDKRQLMVQALLADGFKLRAHHGTRE